MAVLFSVVTVTAGDNEEEFLTAGIPRGYDDLEGWHAFDNLTGEIGEETKVDAQVKAYLMGDGRAVIAEPADIAFLTEMIKEDQSFLDDNCDNIEDISFTFVWSPEELFGMETLYG